MNTFKDLNAEAPELSEGYPRTGRIGPAWQKMWDRLQASGDFMDGRELAAEVSEEVELKASTLVALISRAASAGLLDREQRWVVGTRGPRQRSFYRIPVKR